jgi:four helix bundle protein
MTEIRSYKDLQVWQKSMLLARTVYTETQGLPKAEIFGLQGQMRRAAVSVASNIAEGSRRGTTKDLIHFLRVADGSLAELETQSLLANDIYPALSFIDSLILISEVQRMLAVLIKRLRNSVGTNH